MKQMNDIRKKIIILGCPGSGKSTFAKRLHDRTDIPLIHLDNIWWKEDRSHISRDEFDIKLEAVLNEDEWIIDGDYSRTYEVRIRNCDTIIFLDYDLDTCMEGITIRTGQKREDIPWVEEELDEELVEDVRNYHQIKYPILMELFKKYQDKQLIIFKNRADADKWIKERCGHRMDKYTDERDLKILEKDRYTFFVLRKIIGGNCNLLLSDHERMIICFTCDPFPVWIWTEDGASEEEMEYVYQLAKENNLLDGNHRFNVKYELAQYFINRSEKEGRKMSIFTNMFAYECLNPIKPTDETDGELYQCKESDIEQLVEFTDLFNKELGVDQKDRESYFEDAKLTIETGNMYFWKDKDGNPVACCKYAPDGDMASISLVYTYPQFRRKHYAENMVYQVTMIVKDKGLIPMLYTDADYVASNACYEKIGYELKGKLCTIG